VEEDHLLADGHRSARPGEDDPPAGQLADPEELHPVDQRDDVASSDGNGGAVGDDLGDLLAVPRHGGAIAQVQAVLERLVFPGALRQVPAVEVADGVDRRFGLLGEDLRRGDALADHVVGIELVFQADAIEVLAMPERFLAFAVCRAQLGIGGEQLLAAGVQPQVHRLPSQVLRKLLVLELALLPSGGDGGDAAGHAQLGHRRSQRGIEALRAEENDCGGALRGHRARTLAVRPTKSSMPRSSS